MQCRLEDSHCRERRDTKIMTTAVVVTSIVSTNLGEAKFVDQVLEQVRRNDRDLLKQITAADQDARVVTAILNVHEFMSYAHDWVSQRQAETPKRASRPKTAKRTAKVAAQPAPSPTIVVSEAMNELEFMDYTLNQLRHGQAQPVTTFSAEALEQLEAEPIGEEFSQQPFLY